MLESNPDVYNDMYVKKIWGYCVGPWTQWAYLGYFATQKVLLRNAHLCTYCPI
jgi:hypothetical protein